MKTSLCIPINTAKVKTKPPTIPEASPLPRKKSKYGKNLVITPGLDSIKANKKACVGELLFEDINVDTIDAIHGTWSSNQQSNKAPPETPFEVISDMLN